jgi:hypothetical protein
MKTILTNFKLDSELVISVIIVGDTGLLKNPAAPAACSYNEHNARRREEPYQMILTDHILKSLLRNNLLFVMCCDMMPTRSQAETRYPVKDRLEARKVRRRPVRQYSRSQSSRKQPAAHLRSSSRACKRNQCFLRSMTELNPTRSAGITANPKRPGSGRRRQMTATLL